MKIELSQFTSIWIVALVLSCSVAVADAGSSGPLPDSQAAVSDPAEICIGFSGGGVRAAAMAIGVLRQLHHEGLLSEIDFVAGTSGGSWGLLWLYSNAVKTDNLDEIMGQDSQGTTPALRRAEDGRFFNTFWRGWSFFWGVARLSKPAFYGALVNNFGAGVVGYTGPTEILSAVQKHRLPTPIVTLTALPSQCKTQGEMERISLDDLRRTTIEERTTWFQPLHKYIVEVTPWGWGSPYRGYSTVWPSGFASFEDWVTSSGAYIDFPVVRSCPATALLGATWGQWMSDRSQNIDRFFAVDGGFSENLAAYPLIRRACDLVVIVDAEHDPALQFEGYRKLRSGLERSLDVALSVPPIDAWISDPRYLPIGIDVGQANRSLSMNAADPSLSLVGIPIYQGEYKLRDKRGGQVLYLKLSLDPERADDYPESTKGRYQHATRKRCEQGRKVRSGCDFPHTDTGRTAYAGGEFAAHRDLAAWLVQVFLAPDLREYLRAR